MRRNYWGVDTSPPKQSGLKLRELSKKDKEKFLGEERFKLKHQTYLKQL